MHTKESPLGLQRLMLLIHFFLIPPCLVFATSQQAKPFHLYLEAKLLGVGQHEQVSNRRNASLALQEGLRSLVVSLVSIRVQPGEIEEIR